MKFIDKNGKLFGKISLVDIVAILAVVAIVIGGTWTVFGNQIKDVAAPNVEMTVTMRVWGTFPNMADELLKSDRRLVSGSSFVEGAKIESMTIEEYRNMMPTADGRIVEALDPVKVDVIVVVKSTVAKGTATPRIGNQEVRVARNFILKTQTCEFTARVESVVFGE